MGFVKVRLLDPMLRGVNGDTMHVSEERVAKGVANGLWEVLVEPETKEMTAAPGKKYETKDFLSFRDMYGEDKPK
jgi:hypothetical protein